MTDDDSGDENGGFFNNLYGRQLRARTEIEFKDENIIGDNSVRLKNQTTLCVPLENHT